MGYVYNVSNAFHVKEDKRYPWPCKADPDRTVLLFPSDVLTKTSNSTVTKHTGLMMLNIQVPAEDLVPFEQDPVLQVGSFSEA